MAREHILMTKAVGFGNCLRPNGVENGMVSPIQPPNLLWLGDETDVVTFVLSVDPFVGAATTRSLGLKFQFLQSDSVLGNQFSTPVWYDLDEHAVRTSIDEGVGWSGPGFTAPTGGGFGYVANEATSGTVTVKRTVRNFGRGVRVVFDRPASSTTSNGWPIALTAVY